MAVKRAADVVDGSEKERERERVRGEEIKKRVTGPGTRDDTHSFTRDLSGQEQKVTTLPQVFIRSSTRK